ncbi:MAG: amidotransferase [Bacteroidota bacterium]
MAKKIGLLVCDHVLDKYLHINGSYPQMFAKLLPELELIPYFVLDSEFPEELHACDGYLATGSKYSVYEDIDWIKQLKTLVAQIDGAKIPYLGVCFGHQLLAESTGGKVEKSDKGWLVGVHSFEMLDQPEELNACPDPLNILMMCQDQVQQLPPDTTVLAQSDRCTYAIIQKGEHMLGIQGHPEFSKAYDRKLMEDRVEIMGKEVVEEGIASLDKEVHMEVLAKWMTGFLG